MNLLSWPRIITAVVLIGFLYTAYNAVYSAGYESASLKYEQDMTEQAASYQQQREEKEQQAYQAGLKAASNSDNVTKIYVPVEKEIIKYVSKPVDTTCNADFVAEWVRIHNQAANPSKHTSTAGRIVNDSAAAGTSRN